MFSISSKEYYLPFRSEDVSDVDANGRSYWYAYAKDNTGRQIIITQAFNYTAIDDAGNKMTFVYDDDSVKPAPRTLRIYGADKLSPIVKRLRFNFKLGETFGNIYKSCKSQ